jgi:hypothetical protein
MKRSIFRFVKLSQFMARLRVCRARLQLLRRDGSTRIYSPFDIYETEAGGIGPR